ncbi:MAG TPA: SBBP repeat-containing protein, partial [Flavobacteriales bacterium]|nr:SBBP repeat-containing protein [Flavobacteriales bacterium]
GSQADLGYGIAVDAGGNVYTTGYFNSAAADFDPGTGTYDLTCFVVKDVFISQLDPSGNFLWAGQFGGADYDDGFGITTDGSGNIYAAGDFRSTGDFDPGAGTYDLTCPGFGANAFVMKLSDLSTGMPGNNDPFNALTVYPDPSTGEELWIRLGGLSATIGNVEAEVRDMSGRRVSARSLTAQSGQVKAVMPLPPGAASGVYTVTVTAGGSRWSARWVIARQ